MTVRILLVEDDEVLLDGIKAGLSLHGIHADAVGTCEDAHAALRANSFGAVVLDLMLPDGSGLSVLKELRGRGDRTPVLLLTARDAVEDRVAGLDGGADDYLGKPFDLEEVAARLRAIVRRAQGRSSPLLECRGLILDQARRSLMRDGHPVPLSRREFAILEALMERPGIVLSKDSLQERLYGWQEEVESNAVEVHIHNLRTKIGRDVIQTVRGSGYRLDAAT
ncbi:winged helix-turn-helix domain-containing protein [Muricoccus vinaceus]|uniref:Winged helix-turn-helix domain-containing protein n=1 Tax=Muricoccus vinaceus TaxID=424704 RepID=A0ABV6IVK9_9PROT